MEIKIEELQKYMSEYLFDGLQKEKYVFTSVEIDTKEGKITGLVNIENFFMPLDGKFHLSSVMNIMISSQLMMAYIFYNLGEYKKQEVYNLKEEWRYRKPINKSKDIKYQVTQIAKATRGSTIFYKFIFNVEDRSFLGSMTVNLDVSNKRRTEC
ncbi:MAG TPA: hypothetical protein VG895_05650 [Patescibacteria group bacterium]|nr:hypothetical protein [Patescibacteria group bacterium]